MGTEGKERSRIKHQPALDLESFERSVRLRQLTPDDYDALVELQNLCFPGMLGWDKEHIVSQTQVFPEGQLCIEMEGELVASCSSLIVDFSEYADWHDWKLIADNGFITNHNPQGDTLYGIEVMVHPEHRGMKLARRLYDARKELCRRYNLQRIIVGGRIPGYESYADDMSAEDYVEYVVHKDIYDPVLTSQLSNGFVVRGLIPDYYKTDLASRGFATHLEWINLTYQPPTPIRLQTVAQIRLCVIQWEMRRLRTFDDFCQQVEFFVDTASDYRADFVIFPELFTLELLSLVDARAPGVAARRLAEFTPQYLELFSDLAVRYHINIVAGSHFTLEDDCLYNVAYLFQRNGSIGKQYKLHVTPNEHRWWGISPGNRIEIFDTDCGRVAINVCYDVEFPELARYAAAQDVRLLFVPFNTNERSGYTRVRTCAMARAIENHMYVAISGCVGNLPFVDNADIHYAQSAVFSPSDFAFSPGGVAVEASANIAQVLVNDVDVELIRRHRHNGTTKNWRDRRTDL
ncbi:MAG: GNAT family N-acetyltransferase, partial [Myxococcales bacterium]|nr:GNAT family N-acetyltransferase [Myxococcales bacterium]